MLLRELVSDPSMSPLMPLEHEQQHRYRSLMLGADADEKLVGALYAGDPYTELLDPTVGSQMSPDRVRLFLDGFLMLHGIGVRPAMAGQGIGLRMMERLEAYARLRKKKQIYGVCEPDSAGFYARCGYTVLPPDHGIVLELRERQLMSFPILGAAQWFVRNLGPGPVLGTSPDGQLMQWGS